jgi:hypothetical protein
MPCQLLREFLVDISPISGGLRIISGKLELPPVYTCIYVYVRIVCMINIVFTVGEILYCLDFFKEQIFKVWVVISTQHTL